MDYLLYAAFIVTALTVIALPGPNVLVIVSTSLHQGVKRGLQTVAGTSSAMALQLFIAALASVSLIQLLEQGLSLLKWAGLLYLCYLAIKHLRYAWRGNLGDNAPPPAEAAAWTFSRGFLVSISNPKTILFFTAFLPQFTSARFDYATQIALLSISFLLLAIVCDSLYAILAARLRHAFFATTSRYDAAKAVNSSDASLPQSAYYGDGQRRLLHSFLSMLYSGAALGLFLHSRWRT